MHLTSSFSRANMGADIELRQTSCVPLIATPPVRTRLWRSPMSLRLGSHALVDRLMRTKGAKDLRERKKRKPVERRAKRLIVNCYVCGKLIDDYASSSRNKNKHGRYFCSRACQWKGIGDIESVAHGGDGIKRTKKESRAFYYRRNLEKRRRDAILYYHKNRDRVLARMKLENRKLKLAIIGAFGGSCECCGESNFEFLTIDHIHGGGNEHRRQLGDKGKGLYKEILAEGCPKDKYRLLCWNCNTARGFYGYCPHHPEDKSGVSHVPHRPGRPRKVKTDFFRRVL